MRVAVDFKVVSTEAAMRGMGRYTQQQIREVLSQDPHLELFLFMHGPVPPQNALFDWGLFPNVHTIPVTVDGHDLNYTKMPDFGTILAYSHRIQQLLRRLEVDVFHNTVPFMYPYYSAITVCPVVTTFYDSIPLIFPSDYFVSRDQRLNYLRAMENVTDSARVVAISQSAASDLHLYTGYSPANTHIAYPLIDSTFRHIEDERILQSPIEGRDANSRVDSQRLPERFILSVTGIHRAKNVSVLLDAFKKASRELGEDWGLIIVLPSDYAQTTFTDRFGSPPGVITLRDVSEEGLCLLYNKATMVAQPSTYEGFGYPVAEAMSCGAAVIATDTSSIPEVAGDAAILVSPSDARPLAAAMILLARHPELRSELKRRALRRSKNFSDPRPLGAVTLEAYRGAAGDSGRNALGQPAAPALVRPRVAVWSSMPPLDCGVADYTSELVDALSQTHDVSVYVDGTYATTPPRAPHVRFRHPRDCTIDKEPAPNIFQVGARTYQEFMYPYIRKHGGTMVLHDLAMALGFYWLAKSSGSMNEFEDEIVWPEGLHALEAYARLDLNLTLPPREVQERFFLHHKMLQWLIGRSDRILVHTEPLRRKLLSEYPSANPGVVRMGVVDTTPMQR
ncbi:MAG: glycosyltransferase family 1 protein [Bryobacteraceae bacterium]